MQTNFLLFGEISTKAVVEFGNGCFFKDMNFSESFQTFASGLLSYLVVRIINHMIVFLSDFPFPFQIFHFFGFEEFLFRNFQKITIKKQHDGIYFCYAARYRNDIILGAFFGTPRVNDE